jgi:hypothetical protein
MEAQPSARLGRAFRLVALLALGSHLGGCDMCHEGDLRCNGNVVQECSSSRNWKDFHDCGTDRCGVGRDVCHPFIDLGFGEVWCCYQ